MNVGWIKPETTLDQWSLCTPSVREELYGHQVRTVGQLAQWAPYCGPCPGWLPALQHQAQLALHWPTSFLHHSWRHVAAHVPLPRRSARRVQVCELRVGPLGVAFRLAWYEKRQWHQLYVHPAVLIATQGLWERHEVVSDDSEDDDVEAAYRQYPCTLPPLQWLPEAQPFLDGLPAEQQTLLQQTLAEVQLLQECYNVSRRA